MKRRTVTAVKVAVVLCVTLSATFIARARHGVEHSEYSPKRVIPTAPYVLASSGLGLLLGVLFPYLLEMFRKQELTEEDEADGGAPIIPIGGADVVDSVTAAAAAALPTAGLSCAPSTVIVNCLGGRFVHMPVTSTTTVAELLNDVLDLLEVSSSDDCNIVYGLLVRRVHAHRADVRCAPDALIHEIVSSWANASPSMMDEMEFVANIVGMGKLPASVCSLIPPNADFFFHNACDLVLRRRFLAVETELISLAAMLALAVIGEPPPNVLATNRLPLLPILHPTFVDGLALVPSAALSSKGIFVRATNEIVDGIHRNVLAAWMELKSVVSPNQARNFYVIKVSKCPGYTAEVGLKAAV